MYVCSHSIVNLIVFKYKVCTTLLGCLNGFVLLICSFVPIDLWPIFERTAIIRSLLPGMFFGKPRNSLLIPTIK